MRCSYFFSTPQLCRFNFKSLLPHIAIRPWPCFQSRPWISIRIAAKRILWPRDLSLWRQRWPLATGFGCCGIPELQWDLCRGGIYVSTGSECPSPLPTTLSFPLYSYQTSHHILGVESPGKHTSHSQDKGHWVRWGKQKLDFLTDLQTDHFISQRNKLEYQLRGQLLSCLF